jgi:type IV pilus assembly protein PilM
MASFRLYRGSQAKQRQELSPIGLEFADEQVNLVQLQNAHPPIIQAHASLPYPLERAELLKSPAALKSFLRGALSSGSFAGRKVVTALPAGDVRILSVTYQVRANESDDQAIGKLMQERIGEDLAQFVIDYVPVRTESRDGDRLAMVLLSERSTVIGHLEVLRKAGLDVTALEVSPVAIRRLVSTLISAGEAPQNVLVINAGRRKTYLTMVSGQRLLSDQEIDFGEERVLEQISVALDAPLDVARELIFRHGLDPKRKSRRAPEGVEDTSSTNTILTIARPYFTNLVAEIRRAVLFTSSETRGGQVGHALLMGAVARWPGAAALLSTLSDMPVSIPAPLPLAARQADDGESQTHPELVIAAGLALRGFMADA